MERDLLPNEENCEESSDSNLPAEEVTVASDSKDDQINLSSEDLSQIEWMGGMIQVVFKQPIRPAYLSLLSNILEESPSLILEHAESEVAEDKELQKKLGDYKLVSAEPTFSDSNIALGNSVASNSAASNEGVKSHRNRLVTYYFPEGADLLLIAQELARLPQVERAVPIPKLNPPSAVINQPLLGTTDVLTQGIGVQDTQWYIFRCKVNKAWELASGEGVVIADIDWGFKDTHLELRSRIELKHNSITGTQNISTGLKVGHGTAVLGMVGAEINGVGIAGVAHKASLWAIQAGQNIAITVLSSWENAIKFVCAQTHDTRRKVIILETEFLGHRNIEMAPSINQLIKEAIEANIVVCVPAGNGNLDAGLDIVGQKIPETGSILIGATKYHDTENRRANLSNWGDRVTVSAPGDESHDLTCGIVTDNDYTSLFGQTSGAAPKVAGTVALMLQVNPKLKPAEVKEILITTGTGVISEPLKPAGRFLNAEAAVREAKRRAG